MGKVHQAYGDKKVYKLSIILLLKSFGGYTFAEFN